MPNLCFLKVETYVLGDLLWVVNPWYEHVLLPLLFFDNFQRSYPYNARRLRCAKK